MARATTLCKTCLKQHDEIAITSTGSLVLRKAGCTTTRNHIQVLSDVMVSPSSTQQNSLIQLSAEEAEGGGEEEIKPGPLEHPMDYISIEHAYTLKPGTQRQGTTPSNTTAMYAAHNPVISVRKKSQKQPVQVWNSL